MELVAQAPEQVAGGARGGDLPMRQQAALPCLAQSGDLVPHACDPESGLEIAQAALPLLQVRFEQPDRSAVAAAPLVELLQLVADELLHAALLELGDGGALEAFEELRVAGDQPAVEQRGPDGVVLARELDALLQRARRVAGLEPDVPEGAVELLGDRVRPRAAGIAFAGEQRKEVDVRARSELASAVATGRDQRERYGVGTGDLREDGAEQLRDDFVGERGAGADHLLSARSGSVARQDLLATFRHPRLGPRDRHLIGHAPQHNKMADGSVFGSTAKHAKLFFGDGRTHRRIALRRRTWRWLPTRRFLRRRIPTFWFLWLRVFRGRRFRIVFGHRRRLRGAGEAAA